MLAFLAASAALGAALVGASSDHAALFRWVTEHGGGSHVAIGVSESGLRGLVAQRACAPGDLLLEVPLSLCIADGTDEENTPLAGESPRWTWSLAWNVQLALSVIEQKASGEANPFLDSWPKVPPPLPTACDPAELSLASDPSLSSKADEAFFWLDEQYWIARDAAEAADEKLLDTFPEARAFREAMEFVWSRCLRLSSGPHGVRRLLVPLLDLANHEPVPSAMYAFGHSAQCGPSIRLHAARAMQAGEAVTITYGEHDSTHFATYYGFAPAPNPYDAVQVSLADVLTTLPAEQTVPAHGWQAAIEALTDADEDSADAAALGARTFDLREIGPSAELVDLLIRLLPPPEGGSAAACACRAIASTAGAIEGALWQYGPDGAEASVAADEALLSSSDSTLSDVGALLVRLRLSRKNLLLSLRTQMGELAAVCDRDPADGALQLAQAAAEASEPPSVYPALDAIPVEEMQAWERRSWDWDQGSWAD